MYACCSGLMKNDPQRERHCFEVWTWRKHVAAGVVFEVSYTEATPSDTVDFLLPARCRTLGFSSAPYLSVCLPPCHTMMTTD